jgi:LmbE family N-acetylglucosaminyl deacetylase
MHSLGTILGIWAHPDDETYLMAGIMAEAVERGDRVSLVTATRGEAGSQDHERWPPDQMGAIRERELDDCLKVLGVTEHRWMDYRDGTCDAVPHDEAVAKLQASFEEVQPDSVLTFGPEGMTGHPDHIAVSEWAADAFERFAKPGARLFYAMHSREWHQRWGPLFDEHNVFAPGTPPTLPRAELDVNLLLDDRLTDIKLKAIAAQVSQVEQLHAALGREVVEKSLREESFRVAAEKR